MFQPPDLSVVEYACCFLGMAMQAVCLAARKTPLKYLLPALVATAPVTVLAASSFTRFLGWDESYIFYDIVNFRSSRLPQWEMGSFRTSITVWGPLFSLVQTLIPFTKDQVLVMAKAAHWLTGVALITLIIDRTYRILSITAERWFFHTVMYNLIVALPVTVCALKTLNYDLLSMLLGVLGCVWLVAGAHPVRKEALFAGIAALTLAAHEKLIASPLLWAGVIFTVVRLVDSKKDSSWLKFAVRNGLWSAMTTAVPLLLVGSSFLFVHLTHGSNGPGIDAGRLFEVFTSGFWPLGRLVSAPLSGRPFFASIDNETVNLLFGYAAVTAMVGLIAGLFPGAVRIGRTVNRRPPALSSVAAAAAWAKLSLLLFLTMTGIIAGYALDVKIWPHVPVLPGNYVPRATFNGIAHHFGSGTLFAHGTASTAWACAVFVNALPTTLLGLLIIACIIPLRAIKKRSPSQYGLPLDMAALLFMTAPLLYGALQIPLYPRYLNLFLLGTIVTVIPGLFTIRLRQFVPTACLAVIGLLLLIGECLPFQPLCAAFRPIWSNYSKECHNDPCFGKVTPWYPGWGEELYAAYRRIRHMEPACCGKVRLFYNFPADVIHPPEKVETFSMPVETGQFEYGYGDCDYYILSRNGVSTYLTIPFPYNRKPVFTISDREFVKAWVFRGRELAGGGFGFGKERLGASP
ncbi:MAG: hypothetical protein JXA18_08055 [Chitinispirillaceae bacterium]|nr:hypothetical protein [Chitinispirillaceae bacterium]